MRIAFTHAYSWPEVRRGGERLLHELTQALACRGHDVTVLSTGTRAGRVQLGAVRWHRFKRIGRAGSVSETVFAASIVPELRRGRFDVVHSLGVRDALASVAAQRLGAGHRTVYTNLGIPIRIWWDQHRDGWAHRQVVRHVDVYGCLSQHALDVLARDFGRSGVVTPGGVNVRTFVPGDRAPAPTVLYSGSLDEPRKHVSTLVRAVDRLAERVPDVSLWLSGPGSAPVGRRVQLLPLGAVEDQGERYARAWVTALPSEHEAFGLVVLESLASGTPVVASDDAALPELLEPGVTGVLVRPGDVDALATALLEGLRLAEDPATRQRCRAAAAGHDWNEAVAPHYEALYAA